MNPFNSIPSLRRPAASVVFAGAMLSASAIGQDSKSEQPPVFEPSPAFFQVVSGQLNALDPNHGGYTAIGQKLSSYNAAGFNVLDNYAYAWGRYAPFKNQLIRIHGDGTFAGLGEPKTSGDAVPTFRIYAGDMDYDGHLWIRGDRFNAPDLMKINVENNTYEMVRFSGVNPGSVADLVYMEHDGRGYFYGARNQDLYVWDLENRSVNKVAVKNLPTVGGSYGAAYTDADQALYVSNNNGGVYQILDYATDSPRAVYLLDSAKTGNNDGFSNPKLSAPVVVPANQPPSISITDHVVAKLDGMRLTLNPEISDEGLPYDGGGLQVKWTQQAGPSKCSIRQPESTQCEFRFDRKGTYTVRVSATDGEYTVFEDLFITVGDTGVEKVETAAPIGSDYRDARRVWAQVKEELHCRADGTVLEEEKRGFNKEDFYLERDAEVVVTVIYDGAAARNSLEWYDASNPNMRRSIWHDFATGPAAPLQVGSKASLGVLPAGTHVRFNLVQDGARGGEGLLFQDAELNPGGFNHVAARLFADVEEDRPLIVGFEDREFGGDHDFNDVIFQVDIIEQSLGSAQYSNVIPGKLGLFSDRGSRGVHQTLEKLGMASAEYEVISQLFVMPEGPIELNMLDDRSSMKFDLCAFDYEQVRMLDPSSLAFRVRAAEIAVSVMDDRVANPGTPLKFDPAAHGLAGKTVGFLFVPNNKREVFLRNPWRYTPKGHGERTKRQPLFSLNSANPGALDQLLSFESAERTVFALEDHTRYEDMDAPEQGAFSDSLFDDAMISISPRLQPVNGFAGAYYLQSHDPTFGYDGDDGHAPRADDSQCCY